MGEITARLRSGEVDATEAVRLLVEAVVRQRVGEATPAIKERMRAALQRYLEHDPVLAEKINQLGQGDED